MDEDADLILTMMKYSSSYRAVKALRSAEGKAIHKLPASVGEIVEALKEAGVYKGGLTNG